MKVTKKQVIKQLDTIQTLQSKLSIAVQALEVTLRKVRGTDVTVYQTSGDELLIYEEGVRRPIRIETILDEMEE